MNQNDNAPLQKVQSKYLHSTGMEMYTLHTYIKPTSLKEQSKAMQG